MGYRSLVTAGRTGAEDKVPIHIADIEKMSEAFSRRLAKTTSDPNGTSGRAESTTGRGDKRAASGRRAESGERTPKSGREEESAKQGSRRSRRSRQAVRHTNYVELGGEVHSLTLGEVNQVFYDWSQRMNTQYLRRMPKH